MLRTRVIPVLLLRDDGLVKTTKFDKSKYIGDPINAVKLFNDKEVDEIVLLDIDASKTKKKPNFNIIKEIASECFMPLGYGGGISTIQDVQTLFSLGVEKVILNTAALENLDLIHQSAEIFGNQSIVVSVDVQKNFWGKHTIFSHSGVKSLPKDLVEFLKSVEKAGAGEVILNSIDLDGCMTGYDLKLLELTTKELSIPLVICGGAGNLEHLKTAYESGAAAVAAGSLFIYHGPHKAVLINYPTQKQLKTLFN